MKKKITLIIISLFAIFTLASCTDKADSDIQEVQNTEDVTEAPEITAEPTPEPTAEPTAAPTPDTDPYNKLQITKEEMDTLINFWSVDGIDVHDQGTLDDIVISATDNYIDMNYFFTNDNSFESIKSEYSTVLGGEWEKDEYSAGPLLEATTAEGNSVLCQLISEGSVNDLSVFISRNNAEDADTLAQLFSSKFPVGLIPDHEVLSEDNAVFMSIQVTPDDMTAIYQKGYFANGRQQEILDFYKDALSSYDDFGITANYDGGDMIICSVNGITISIYYEDFSEQIIVEYDILIVME